MPQLFAEGSHSSCKKHSISDSHPKLQSEFVTSRESGRIGNLNVVWRLCGGGQVALPDLALTYGQHFHVFVLKLRAMTWHEYSNSQCESLCRLSQSLFLLLTQVESQVVCLP